MKRSVICTLLLVLLYYIPQAQIGVFTKVNSDTANSKDFRFRQLPGYSLYSGITNIISPITGTYDLTTPPGTTAQRPMVPAGKYILRYNTDSTALEIGNPSQVWRTLGMASVQTFDTSSIPNFSLKSRSLLSTSNPLQYNAVTGHIAIQQSNSSQPGYLASADWVIFNAKLPDPGSNGFTVRTAAGTVASRQLVAASTNISLVNPNGVSGNPSIDVNDTLTLSQLKLPYIPATPINADSVLYLNRSTGNIEVRPSPAGGAGTIQVQNSITGIGSSLDKTRFVNDTSLNTATGRKFSYQLDTTGRRAYYEDKYISGKTFAEIRKLRIPDTSYIFRVNVEGVIGYYKYDPSDVSTTDDTVITIVSTAGYRYKRYVPDGTFDPKWWGAKANGTADDTEPVKACLRAVLKYYPLSSPTNGQGAAIQLFGYYKFNPATFVYPNISCTFKIKGAVILLDTWKLPAHWNIEGYGNSAFYAVFARGTFASVSTGFTNATSTPKAAIDLAFGTQIIKNLVIESHVGVGIHLNGTQLLPASQTTLENVYVNCNGYTGGGDQIGIRISDWFWATFINCSSIVEQAVAPNKPGSTVLIEGKTVPAEGNYCYLLDFQHLITQGRPIRIKSAGIGAPGVNVPIFNVKFQDCTFENIQNDPAAIEINSTDIGVSNVLLDYCATADCPSGTYLLKNIGHATSGVTINNQFDRFLYTGDAIQSLTVNGVGTSFPTMQSSWGDNISNQGQQDVKNLNRGWIPPLDLIRFQSGGGQIVRCASDMKIVISGFLLAPFTGWNGDTIAAKMAPSPSNYTDIIFKTYGQVFHKGQKVVFGCWLKVDTVQPGTSATQLMAYFNNPGYTFKETGTKEHVDASYPQISKQWQFISSVGIIDTADGTVQTLKVGFRNNGTYDTVLFSNPFVLIVDSTYEDAEVLRWAKEYKGGVYGAANNTYALRDDVDFVIGDSTRFRDGILQRNIGGVWTTVGASSSITGTASNILFFGSGGSPSEDNNFTFKTSTSRVGIGTSSPAGRLSIHGDGAVNANFINMVDNGTSGVTYSFQNRFGGTAGTFSLVNVGSGSSLFTVNNAGNFGINNNNPGFRLDVTGSAHVTGDATLDGNVNGTGDNVIFSQLGSHLGFVKQAGFASFIGIANTQKFTVKKNNTSSITGTGTYTSLFEIDNTGQGKLPIYTGSTFETIDTSYKVLVVDVNGNIFKRSGAANLPSITSINSMTGPTLTLTTGTGLTSSSASNTFTVFYDINSTDVHNVLNKTFIDANNSGTSETDLYSYTLPANKLINNGASIHLVYTGTNNDATATTQIQGYFAGNNVYNSTALTLSAVGDWRIEIDITRVTSTTARASANFFADNTTVGTPIKYTALTGLDFTTTNIFKVTGTAAGATGGSNDITGAVGKIIFEP